MGYSTRFSLETSADTEEILTELFEVGAYDYLDYALCEDGSSNDECKWYEHETDMRNISKEFPSVLFTLKGEGEEAGDVWIKYFKNGKMQCCPAKITFDEFDENKLK